MHERPCRNPERALWQRAAARLRGFVRRAVSDRRATVSVIFGLAVVPMTVSVGCTADYFLFVGQKARFDEAADSASLAAVSRTALSLTATDAQALALKVFKAQAAANASVPVGTASAVVNDVNGVRSVTVSYTATATTSFLNIFGLKTLNLAGSAAATGAMPTYIDFYLALDNTPSMGVAATTADITKMEGLTGGCAFACHITGSTNDNYAIAKKNNVTTRIDVLRTATQQLMDTAKSTAVVTGQFRMGIYTFGTSADTLGLTPIYALSSDLDKAKTAAATIDLMTMPYQGYNSDMTTDLDGVMVQANKAIPTPGSGASSSVTPQKVLFIVSDGLNDHYNNSCSQAPLGGGRCQEPITVANCTTIKNRGIKIAVLYTTYLPLPSNDWYNTTVAPFASKIGANMQSCASPGLYFEVSPSGGIAQAMSALFQKAVQAARLTS